MAQGPHWCTIEHLRNSALQNKLLANGELQLVQVAGAPRLYLVASNFAQTLATLDGIAFDNRVRFLAPLDPMLWDRQLVESVFGFAYVWEVYKKPEQRQWGYYVTPMLYRGRLFGRIELKRSNNVLFVAALWLERDAVHNHHLPSLDGVAAALARHARSCNTDCSTTLEDLRVLWDAARTDKPATSKQPTPVATRKRTRPRRRADSDEDEEELSTDSSDSDDSLGDDVSCTSDSDGDYKVKRRRVVVGGGVANATKTAMNVRRSLRFSARTTEE
jgi:hypothetical protein